MNGQCSTLHPAFPSLRFGDFAGVVRAQAKLFVVVHPFDQVSELGLVLGPRSLPGSLTFPMLCQSTAEPFDAPQDGCVPDSAGPKSVQQCKAPFRVVVIVRYAAFR